MRDRTRARVVVAATLTVERRSTAADASLPLESSSAVSGFVAESVAIGVVAVGTVSGDGPVEDVPGGAYNEGKKESTNQLTRSNDNNRRLRDRSDRDR